MPPDPTPPDPRAERTGPADPGPGTHAIWNRLPEAVRGALARVEAVVMDADGVLTDGRITIASDGTESMTFHVRDGSGTWMLHKSGLKVGVITGRDTGILERGNGGLKLDRVIAGSRAKDEALLRMLGEWGLPTDACVFIGDDILDAPALRTAGVPVCVADATREVREMALYVTHRAGGHGAVREVADLVLHARGLRDGLVASFTERPLTGQAEETP